MATLGKERLERLGRPSTPADATQQEPPWRHDRVRQYVGPPRDIDRVEYELGARPEGRALESCQRSSTQTAKAVLSEVMLTSPKHPSGHS